MGYWPRGPDRRDSLADRLDCLGVLPCSHTLACLEGKLGYDTASRLELDLTRKDSGSCNSRTGPKWPRSSARWGLEFHCFAGSACGRTAWNLQRRLFNLALQLALRDSLRRPAGVAVGSRRHRADRSACQQKKAPARSPSRSLLTCLKHTCDRHSRCW